MNRLFSARLIFIVLLLSTTRSFSQPKISSVSLKIGLIRNLSSEFEGENYSFYPEIQIGGPLVTSNLIRWGLNFGYWDDGVNKLLPIADYITYSYHSLIIGTRLDFMPGAKRKDLPVQPSVFVGFSHHFVGADYVGGEDLVGNIGKDFRSELNYAEIGFSAQVKLKNSLYIILEVQQSIRFGDARNFQENRRALKTGIAYSF